MRKRTPLQISSSRAAESISNVLTPLTSQIETSSGARRGAGRERRQDDLRGADAAKPFGRTGSAYIWRLIAALI